MAGPYAVYLADTLECLFLQVQAGRRMSMKQRSFKVPISAMIVDDDPLITTMLSQYLQQMGGCQVAPPHTHQLKTIIVDAYSLSTGFKGGSFNR